MAEDPLPEISAKARQSDAWTKDLAIRGMRGGAPRDELEGVLALAKYRGKGCYAVAVEHVRLRG